MKVKDWDKISGKYDEEISSPLDRRVDNPLYAEIKKIRGKKNKKVLEVGCGPGFPPSHLFQSVRRQGRIARYTL